MIAVLAVAVGASAGAACAYAGWQLHRVKHPRLPRNER
jgi:hypothetical protein